MNQILKPSVDKNDYIECEYCKNKLYRKTIEWKLYGDKKVLTLELIKNGIPIIYGTLINLLAELKNSYDSDNNISEMEIIKLYEKVDLLIIDDLGKEKPSEWGLEKLFTIINSRYENNLPVIITTNYNQNSLAERLSLNGEIETARSIISRLYEMCYLVKINDIDHRIKKKKVSNCGNND